MQSEGVVKVEQAGGVGVVSQMLDNVLNVHWFKLQVDKSVKLLQATGGLD